MRQTLQRTRLGGSNRVPGGSGRGRNGTQSLALAVTYTLASKMVTSLPSTLRMSSQKGTTVMAQKGTTWERRRG